MAKGTSEPHYVALAIDHAQLIIHLILVFVFYIWAGLVYVHRSLRGLLTFIASILERFMS